MVPQPEQEARKVIDELLAKAGWTVCDAGRANLSIGRGVAIREFPLKSGHGFADYLLYVNGKAAGREKLKKDIRAELNEDVLEKFHGTKSLPFEAGESRKMADKIVDDRGIESLKILPLE